MWEEEEGEKEQACLFSVLDVYTPELSSAFVLCRVNGVFSDFYSFFFIAQVFLEMSKTLCRM